MEDSFSMDWGGGLGMIQAHYTHCAFYFFFKKMLYFVLLINNVVIVSDKQGRDLAIQIHVSILPQPYSHPGCQIALSRVPWVKQ